MVDLSIIIVSWNTSELLKECLNSLYQYTTGITFEVFVVDNASSDGSADMVRELFPQVNVIANSENLGFSKANNQAIRISNGRYVALLNPDTLLIEDVFSPLIKYADQHYEIGAIGPKILNRDGKTIQYVCARRLPNLYFDFCRFTGFARKFPKARLFGGEYMSYWDHNSSRYVECLSGACMVVKKKAIDDVGLMDENQFLFGDEIDWCKRLLDRRWKNFYHSEASIIHYGGESSSQVKLFSQIEAAKSKYYYYKKHKSRIYAAFFSAQLFFIFGSKYMWSIYFRNKNSQVKELIHIYKGVFDWTLKQ